jgi:hypothetical protein
MLSVEVSFETTLLIFWVALPNLFCGVLRAIEIANQLNWSNLWVETDSSLTVLAFKDDTA